jgi:hypothetical protein
MARACACAEVSWMTGELGREKDVWGKWAWRGREGSKEDKGGMALVDFHQTSACWDAPPMERMCGRAWVAWSFSRRRSRERCSVY